MRPISFKSRSDPSGRKLLWAAATVFLGGCCLGLLCLYFSTGEYGLGLFRFYLTQPLLLAVNILPFVLLSLVFFCLCNRAWGAFFLTGVLCLGASWAQYWKLIARSSPIYAEDLLILSEAVQMSGEYIRVTWQIVLSAILVILGTVLLKCFFSGRFSGWRWRVAIPALVAALCCWLYPHVYSSAQVYDSMSLWPELNPWFQVDQYISRGGIYPFLFSIQSAGHNLPEGYDPEQVRALLAEYGTEDIPEDRQVSVICVMYEAFADLSGLTDAITGADPYESFHTLQAESYSGRLITNIFAGNTTDTERRVLTGCNILSNYRLPAWSYARYFSEQGYSVNGAHAGHGPFYDRRSVNANLGISDMRFFDGYYEKLYEDIPVDALFLPDVARYCAQQMEDGPVFSYNVTYQNHGPYDAEQGWFSREYVPRGNLTQSDHNIINNYLMGIEDTANQMLAMADFFRESENGVVLVFFGDHKPWLGDQSSTYRALGIDIFSESDEAFRNYYSTEYTIWANDAAREILGRDFTGTGPDISPCFLMNLVFQQCGWEGPGLTKFTDELMDSVTVLHSSGRYLVDGSFLSRDQLSEELVQKLAQMNLIQHYLTYESNGTLP